MSLQTQLARWVVRCYPRPWRARYGAEMLALVEQEPVSVAEIIDLARACSGEWWRAGVDNRSPVARTAYLIVRALARLGSTVAAAMAIVGAGAAIAWLAPPAWGLSDFTRRLSLLSSLVQMAMLMRLFVPVLLHRPARYAVLRQGETWIWVVVLIICSATRQSIGSDFLDAFLFPFLFVSFLWRPEWRAADLQGARQRLESAQTALESSRRTLWHLDDYQRMGQVTEAEFEHALAEELTHLEAVKRERATIARLRSW